MDLIAPSDIVDRGDEAKRFEDLLEMAAERRVLAVSDDIGWGKSTLLRKLRHLCECRQIPVALIFLNELAYSDEFTLIATIADQLRQAGLILPSFDKMNRARAFRDAGQFIQSYQTLQGAINTGGASISGGQMAGVMFNIQRAENVELAHWTDETEKEARLLCLEAFLADLFSSAAQRPIVIMIDSVESADEFLQRWLLLSLIMNRVLARPDGDHKLLVVLSGEKLDILLQSYFRHYDKQFDFIQELGGWSLADTERMLQVHRLGGLERKLVEDIHGWIAARNISLSDAISIGTFLKNRPAAQ
jgi:hypothetical protein